MATVDILSEAIRSVLCRPVKTAQLSMPGIKPTVLGSKAPTVLGSRPPTTLGGIKPSTLGTKAPTVLGSRAPTVLGGGKPTVLGSKSPTSLGYRAPTVLGSKSPTVLGSRPATTLGSRAPTVLGSRSPTVLGGRGNTGYAKTAMAKKANPLFDPFAFPLTHAIADRVFPRNMATPTPPTPPAAPAPSPEIKPPVTRYKVTTLDDVLPKVNTWGDRLGGDNDFIHDTLNNYQMQYERAANTLGNVGAFIGKKIDPRMWGSSPDAVQRRALVDAGSDIVNELHEGRMASIARNMRTGLDDIENNTLARINLGANAGLGDFAGGAIPTAGAGVVARAAVPAVAGGFSRLAAASGGRVSQAVDAAARFVSSQGPRAAKLVDKSRGFLNRIGPAVEGGINDVGTAINAPLRILGSASQGTKDLPTVRQGARAAINYMNRAYVNPAVRAIRNPIPAMRYAVRHPWATTRRVLGPIDAAVSNPKLWYYPFAGYAMHDSLLSGDPAGAAGIAGGTAALGTLYRMNPWAGFFAPLAVQTFNAVNNKRRRNAQINR